MNAEKSIFYHIYPLGFCGNEGIKKVINSIEHIKYTGANAVYFSPVFESLHHGYDTSDYYKIDRRLGTNEDFKEVCSALHANDISIVLDGVFNHVGRDFWAFQDVKTHKGNSRYCDWFKLHWNCNNRYDDGFAYEDWEGCDDLVKLNLQNPEVKSHLFEAVRFWVENFNIDGLRLDVAYCLDLDFLRELHNFCKTLKPNFWLMGETLHGDYNTWMNPEMLDSVTNYECYKGLFSSCNDKNMFEIAYSMNRQKSLYGGKFLYNFVDNHDVNRISTNLKDKRDLKLIYTLLFCMPGIPSVYYGSEIGLEGDKNLCGDRVLRPYLENIFGNDLTEHISRLSSLRKENEAFVYGEYKQLQLTNEVLVFSREMNNEKVVCAINIGEKDFRFSGADVEAVLPPKSSHVFVNGHCVLWTTESTFAGCA